MIKTFACILALIAFGLIAYELSPLMHTLIDTMIKGISAFDIVADTLQGINN
jgi:hypothetical protein